ncbi:MAG: TRAP transporter substrate-binding protein [Bacillota bacterium]
MKKIKFVNLLLVILLFALLLSGCAQGKVEQGSAPAAEQKTEQKAEPKEEPKAEPKPITLSYAFFAPAQSFPGVQMQKFAEEVEKRTNGLVKFETFPGGTLLDAAEMYDGVLSGVADIGLGAPGYDAGRFPLSSGIALPVGFPNAQVASMTMWDLIQEFKPEEYAKYKIITVFTGEPGHIISVGPIRTLEDLAGLQIRCRGADVPVMKALGASPTAMSMPDVAQALATKAISANMGSREVLKDFKLAELVKYANDYSLTVLTFAAVMDINKWNELPADVQKVMEEVGKEMVLWTAKYHDIENVQDAMEWAKKEYGLQEINLSPEEKARWDKKIEPLIEEWIKDMEAKGLPGRQFINRLLELKDKYAKEYK